MSNEHRKFDFHYVRERRISGTRFLTVCLILFLPPLPQHNAGSEADLEPGVNASMVAIPSSIDNYVTEADLLLPEGVANLREAKVRLAACGLSALPIYVDTHPER